MTTYAGCGVRAFCGLGNLLHLRMWEDGLDVWRWARATIWTVMIRAKLGRRHGDRVAAKLHLFVGDLGIVFLGERSRELVVC